MLTNIGGRGGREREEQEEGDTRQCMYLIGFHEKKVRGYGKVGGVW